MHRLTPEVLHGVAGHELVGHPDDLAGSLVREHDHALGVGEDDGFVGGEHHVRERVEAPLLLIVQLLHVSIRPDRRSPSVSPSHA
jgi:hypothetical protein